MSAFTLRSSAFENGQPIPKQYTGDGVDLSPPLAWDNVPEGTLEFALLCDDPDAPVAEPWVHWVIYKIAAAERSLPEGVQTDPQPKSPAASLQGRNSWKSGKTIGYRGPAPPPGHGVHHYHFRLYALNAPLSLLPKAEKKQLLKAIQGHVLGEALLVGTYQR